jgi:methylamine dehydrogenase light chain
MAKLDISVEKFARSLARNSSRRGVLGVLGAFMVGQTMSPLLPIARAAGGITPDPSGRGVASQSTGNPQDPGDPTQCEYWRYCGIDGFLCACCGGSQTACPPGTEMSPITWVGTCFNPADQRRYIISYNDCCGVEACGRCLCNRNETDKPMARPQENNDINWCLGARSRVYNCSTAVILGVASGEE